MGLDFGDRRIGVAVSDELGLIAQPLLTLMRTNRRQDLKSIQRLLRKYNCSAIVVGNPLYMSGDLSPQAAKAQAFVHLVHPGRMIEAVFAGLQRPTSQCMHGVKDDLTTYYSAALQQSGNLPRRSPGRNFDEHSRRRPHRHEEAESDHSNRSPNQQNQKSSHSDR